MGVKQDSHLLMNYRVTNYQTMEATRSLDNAFVTVYSEEFGLGVFIGILEVVYLDDYRKYKVVTKSKSKEENIVTGMIEKLLFQNILHNRELLDIEEFSALDDYIMKEIE